MTETWTAAQYREYLAASPTKRANKYGAKRKVIDGITFDSIMEAERYKVLKLRERAGEITDLAVHSPFPLMVDGQLIATYVADFDYLERHGGAWLAVVEDVKGHPTREYRLKKKLFLQIWGKLYDFREIKKPARARKRKAPRSKRLAA